MEKHLLKMQQFFMTGMELSLSSQVGLLGNLPSGWKGHKGSVCVCLLSYLNTISGRITSKNSNTGRGLGAWPKSE